MNKQLLNYYEAIERASADMLEAARVGDWDQVVQLEGACAVLITQLKLAAQQDSRTHPMFQPTEPASLDPLGSPDRFAEFRVTDSIEIRALLKSLMDAGVLVNLSASDGSAYTTTLWMVDSQQRKIAFTADMRAPNVERIVEADEAVAVAYLDQVERGWNESAACSKCVTRRSELTRPTCTHLPRQRACAMIACA